MTTTEFKKNLKNMPTKELYKTLEELQKERNKFECKMMLGANIRSYPTEPQGQIYGNLKKIKKNIARVKTFLNIKLKNNVIN